MHFAYRSREQLSKTKKKSAKKVVSASARCLTDGDQLYENEFIQVPKTRRKRCQPAAVTISCFVSKAD